MGKSRAERFSNAYEVELEQLGKLQDQYQSALVISSGELIREQVDEEEVERLRDEIEIAQVKTFALERFQESKEG